MKNRDNCLGKHRKVRKIKICCKEINCPLHIFKFSLDCLKDDWDKRAEDFQCYELYFSCLGSEKLFNEIVSRFEEGKKHPAGFSNVGTLRILSLISAIEGHILKRKSFSNKPGRIFPELTLVSNS